MSTLLIERPEEFVSGEVVAPGVYVDVETGSILRLRESDELPEGARMVHYSRRFRRLNTDQSRTERS